MSMETKRLYEVATEALAFWGLTGAQLDLIAQRENAVFRVQQGENCYALRLHRPGYQTAQAMASELAWMDSLKAAGVQVPAPIASQQGEFLIAFGGYHIDLLTWLYGTPMARESEPLQVADRNGTFFAIGQLMAQLHEQADHWQRPAHFERMAWDREGLLGENPLWGRFWENPELPKDLGLDLIAARAQANDILSREKLDYGLIHADLVRQNILIDESGLQLIDFDDSGFGYRLFDVATTLGKNWLEPDKETLQLAFIEGYETVRQQQWQYLPLLNMLRAFTYVGWIVPRINEPGSQERQQRFFKQCRLAVDEFNGELTT